jgi:hypothetical protein
MASPRIRTAKQDKAPKREKDDMGNKGRRGKGPKPMKGARKAKRESARQERRNLVTKNPVVDRSSTQVLSTGTPALKSTNMQAQQSHDSNYVPSERDMMHATDFGKRSIDKNPSIKVITDQIRNIGMMDDNYNTGNEGKGPNPMNKLKKN